MISMKAAILASTLVVGAAGITAYASGAFCTTETAQNTVAQTILTSGGDKACCASETKGTKAVAQNAVFTPTAQTASLAGGTCAATAKQTADVKASACGAKETAQTASLASAGKSCSASEASAQKTMAQNALYTPTVQNAALSSEACPATAKQTADVKAASCGDKAAVQTTSLASAENSCCAMDGAPKTSSKTTLAGVVPTATTTN